MKSSEFEYQFSDNENYFRGLAQSVAGIDAKLTLVLENQQRINETKSQTLTTAEVCSIYSVDRKTLRKYVKEGKIPKIELSPKKHQFLKTDCDKFFLTPKN